MRLSPISDRDRRAMVATALTVAIQLVVVLPRWLPDWLSQSSPPRTLLDVLEIIPIGAAIRAIFSIGYYLPGSIAVHWIMRRRGVHGPRATLLTALIASTVAIVSTWLFAWAIDLSAGWDTFVRTFPTMLDCILFYTTWLVTYDRLTPVTVEAPAQRSDFERALRTALETFVVLLVLSMTVVLGVISGFDDPGIYEVEKRIPSPDSRMTAHIVSYSYGGALGSTDSQVYLLPAAAAFTSTQRGLLVWSGHRAYAKEIRWEGPRRLRVLVETGRPHELDKVADAYSRSGFELLQEALPVK